LTPQGEQEALPLRGPLLVEGRLEVGRKQAPDGTLSLFRIVLDAVHSRKAPSRAPKEKQ
jgi:hypothetical protein